MLNNSSKYGSIIVNGVSVNVDEANLEDLDKHIKKIEKKREELIEEQNNYVSQIIG